MVALLLTTFQLSRHNFSSPIYEVLIEWKYADDVKCLMYDIKLYEEFDFHILAHHTKLKFTRYKLMKVMLKLSFSLLTLPLHTSPVSTSLHVNSINYWDRLPDSLIEWNRDWVATNNLRFFGYDGWRDTREHVGNDSWDDDGMVAMSRDRYLDNGRMMSSNRELSSSRLITHMWSGKKRKLEKESERAENKRSIFVTFSRFFFQAWHSKLQPASFHRFLLGISSFVLYISVSNSRWWWWYLPEMMYVFVFFYHFSNLCNFWRRQNRQKEKEFRLSFFVYDGPTFGHFKKTSICCWLAIFCESFTFPCP